MEKMKTNFYIEYLGYYSDVCSVSFSSPILYLHKSAYALVLYILCMCMYVYTIA